MAQPLASHGPRSHKRVPGRQAYLHREGISALLRSAIGSERGRESLAVVRCPTEQTHFRQRLPTPFLSAVAGLPEVDGSGDIRLARLPCAERCSTSGGSAG